MLKALILKKYMAREQNNVHLGRLQLKMSSVPGIFLGHYIIYPSQIRTLLPFTIIHYRLPNEFLVASELGSTIVTNNIFSFSFLTFFQVKPTIVSSPVIPLLLSVICVPAFSLSRKIYVRIELMKQVPCTAQQKDRKIRTHRYMSLTVQFTEPDKE